jgi:hypothetical protein
MESKCCLRTKILLILIRFWEHDRMICNIGILCLFWSKYEENTQWRFPFLTLLHITIIAGKTAHEPQISLVEYVELLYSFRHELDHPVFPSQNFAAMFLFKREGRRPCLQPLTSMATSLHLYLSVTERPPGTSSFFVTWKGYGEGILTRLHKGLYYYSIICIYPTSMNFVKFESKHLLKDSWTKKIICYDLKGGSQNPCKG